MTFKTIPKNNKELKKRFEERIEKTESCWLWKGTKYNTGYGTLRFKMQQYLAHRLSFVLYKKELLSSKLVIDHLCNNRGCVNPEHLKQTTIYLNAMRGWKRLYGKNYSVPKLFFDGKCRAGHDTSDFTKIRPYIKDDVVMYQCIKCNLEAKKRSNSKKLPTT